MILYYYFDIIVAKQSKKLSEALPILFPNHSMSGPSIPLETQHNACSNDTRYNFKLCDVPHDVLNGNNSVWLSPSCDDKQCVYHSEADVVHFVRNYIESIIVAGNLQLHLGAEIGIQHVRPDLCVITSDRWLVGVVEVKKPGGKDILLQPTVLGELLDQMLLVSGFYCIGPIIGILTTGVEWMVAWFPSDDDTISMDFSDCVTLPNVYQTPVKTVPVDDTGTRGSPPCDTPSRTKPAHHGFVDNEEGEMKTITEECKFSDNVPRVLHVTKVYNSQDEDPKAVLTLVYSALRRMLLAKLNFSKVNKKLLFMLFKEETHITWHAVESMDRIAGDMDYSNYPPSDTKKLIAIDDLGRGSTGRTWLTATHGLKSVCVLKFLTKSDANNEEKLKKERDCWIKVYGDFLHINTRVRVEKWSGSYCLVMPHFGVIQETEREGLKDKIAQLLSCSFYGTTNVHYDVKWRNIGGYMEGGELYPILYDMEMVKEYREAIHSTWIRDAINYLYDSLN